MIGIEGIHPDSFRLVFRFLYKYRRGHRLSKVAGENVKLSLVVQAIRIFFISFLLFIKLSFGMTLEEAINIARSDTTKIKLSSLDIQKAKEQIRQARASILPQVSFNYSYTHLDKELTSGINPRDRHSYNLELSQMVFNLQSFRSIQTAKENLELQKLIYWDINKEVEYQTKDLFYALLYKRKVVDIRREELKYWEENYKLAEEKYRAGIIPKVELLRAESQLEGAKASLESAKIDYLNSLESFRAFLRVESISEPEGDLGFPPFTPSQDLKDKVLRNNSTLKVVKKLLELQEKRLEQVRAAYYPNVRAFASYQGSSTKRDMVDGYTLGLSLSYTLFDGFSRESNIAQQEIEILKQREQLIDTQFSILSSTNKVLNSLSSLKTQIRALETSLKASEESLRLSRERYRLGIATQLEVLDAVSKYNNILLNLYYAYYQYNSQKALLDRLVD